MSEKPKVIQIAVMPGIDGPEVTVAPRLFVLYDNGLVFHTVTHRTAWEHQTLPNGLAEVFGRADENS